MVTAISRQRVESPERWAKALQRAIEQGVEPLQIAGAGEWVVTSASKLGTVYRTDGFSCECEAAMHGDPCCQHRAVVRFVRGLLTMPEAVALTSTPASVDCGVCHGRGWAYVETHGGAGIPDRIPCYRCGGTGQMPVRLRTITPQPTSLAAD